MALLPRPDYSNGLLPWRCFLFAMGYGHGIATDLERAMGYCHGIAYYMRWATAMASLRSTTLFNYGRPRTRTGETSKNQHRQPWPQKPTGQGGHEPEGHSPRGAVARARRPRTGRSRSGHNISHFHIYLTYMHFAKQRRRKNCQCSNGVPYVTLTEKVHAQ